MQHFVHIGRSLILTGKTIEKSIARHLIALHSMKSNSTSLQSGFFLLRQTRLVGVVLALPQSPDLNT